LTDKKRDIQCRITYDNKGNQEEGDELWSQDRDRRFGSEPERAHPSPEEDPPKEKATRIAEGSLTERHLEGEIDHAEEEGEDEIVADGSDDPDGEVGSGGEEGSDDGAGGVVSHGSVDGRKGERQGNYQYKTRKE
jgi:hypothetical protein